ncbi:MAG: ribulose-phosphate 3-epimerase, partial [Clostridia bacterium]|nr:ribulose-phosphate 3-epimerase [Clostridia bacterium]
EEISLFGADVIHLDVMDGVFVPNITFGPKFVKNLRPYSDKTFDAHLMIVDPQNFVEKFAEAGADIITVHYEACKENLKNVLKQIKDTGVKCGVVINPNTDAEKIFDVLDYVDMALVMSVYPGFGGQKFIPETLKNVEKLKEFAIKNSLVYDIEIDGGINFETVTLAKSAGANVIVAGNTIFTAPDRKSAIERLKNG